MAQSARLTPRFSRYLIPKVSDTVLFFLVLSLILPPPALALRPEPPTEAEPQALSGLEESLTGLEEARFVPWEGAPDKVLVRPAGLALLPEKTQKMVNDSLEISRSLYERIHLPIVAAYLKGAPKVSYPPLVLLSEISAVARKPVFLWREGSSFPTDSTKPRMLAPLFDLYLNGDPHNVTGRKDQPLPEVLATQSTGNHGLAMAWLRFALSEVAREKRLTVSVPEALIYTMKGIPPLKKKRATDLGAIVRDEFNDYGEARREMAKEAQRQGSKFLYWHHGTWPVIFGNMTAAFDLKTQIDRQLRLQGKRIAIVSSSGAGGRIAGLALGLKQVMPDRIKIVAAQTPSVSPVFKAVQEGRPAAIKPLAQRPVEDGIYVDQMEPEALEVFQHFGDAVAQVEQGDELSFTHWLLEDLVDRDWRAERKTFQDLTEGVSGVALAVPFRYPKLFEDVDAIIIDETGANVDPEDFVKIMSAPLPEVATSGLEERPFSMDFDATPYLGIRGLSAKDVWEVLREHFTSV